MITNKTMIYTRDKRSPKPKDERTSYTFSQIKAKNTKPEVTLRKKLRESGIKGYRVHYKSLPGRPDILFKKAKLSIFVNGCFWHRCPYCNLPTPKYNNIFWKDKFEKNKLRDKTKAEKLIELGFKVITIWECQIKEDICMVISEIIEALPKNNK